MGMPHAEPTGNGLESGIVHFIHIPNRPIRDRAHTAQGAMHIAVDFTPE